ncbi:sensor histidine kinase [Yaniella flava]|uniref:histidine kinase n=1 Tax=Yaniella flava TaxID=287930 RepID=A0ABN2UCC4_9MICC
MTTTARKHRLVSVLLNILAVLVMMIVGLFVSLLAILTAPENFDGSFELLTDLGALRVLLALLLLCLLPWYRKIPLALIMAGGFYAVIAQGDPYVLGVGLTVWIVRAQHRWQWTIAAGGLAAMVLNLVWHILAIQRMGEQAATAEAILAVLTLGFAAIGTVLSISLITRQRRSINEAHAEVEAVEHDRDAISTQMTRQTEREYLAREVHDTLAQRLTALSLQTGQMQKSLDDTDPNELSSALEETKHYSDQALRDLRSLVTSLRDQGEKEASIPSVAPGGFQDLRVLFDDAAHQGLKIQPQVLLDSYDTASDETQRAVLRITQEALTNVMRYSPDRTVQLRVEGQPGYDLLLEFTNRRDPSRDFTGGSGTGLLGIKERAEIIGGTAQEEILDEHFRLTVTLPWPTDERTQP